MTAQDLHEHMRKVGPWVDWDGGTCDGFKWGDPATQVTGIAVAWMSTLSALRQARDLGCELFITHEPTFYAHMEDNDAMRATQPAQAKIDLLDESGMVVYRCHDVWDVFPKLGVVDSWAAGLGLSGPPVAEAKYYAAYEVGPVTVEQLAREIAARVRPLGQNAVEYSGPPDQAVTRLAVGTGAITNPFQMLELGADCLLVTDDGVCGWAQTTWLIDQGIPSIRVNHCVAEEWGVENLAGYLRETFAPVPVHYVGIGSLYTHVW